MTDNTKTGTDNMTDNTITAAANPRTEAEINDIVRAAFTGDRRAAFEELGVAAASVETGIRAALRENPAFTEAQVAEALDNDIRMIGERKRKHEEAEAAHQAEMEAAQAEADAEQRRAERVAIAGMALQGLLAGPIPAGSDTGRRMDFGDVVRLAVDYADMLLTTIDQQETQH